MKVTIEREACIECGLCASTCPEVFELKDGEKAAVTPAYRQGDPSRGEVNDERKACTQEAADACPVQAISTG